MEQLFTPDILTLISVFLSPYQAPHQQQELRVGGTDANASETVNEIIDTQLLRVCFSLGQKEEGCHRDTGHSLAAVPGRSGRGLLCLHLALQVPLCQDVTQLADVPTPEQRSQKPPYRRIRSLVRAPHAVDKLHELE